MSTLAGFQDLRGTSELPQVKALDEALWHAWVARGRAHDRRSRATRMKAVKWVGIASLFAAAGLWSHLAPYEVAVRFMVAACAIVVMFQAFFARRYVVAAVFGALALLYNPAAAVFSFSGDWHRALVVMSAVPFVVSLAWRNERVEHDE